MNNEIPQIDKEQARKAFSIAADSYDSVAVLQREISSRMMQRLDLVKLIPERILDAGCGTGADLDALMQRYKKAHLVALDFAVPMLHKAKKRGGWFRRATCVCGDLDTLPLADNSVDLIHSNVALQWVNDPVIAFKEFKRILKPDGLLMFTTFGPDTLKELRYAWSEVDQVSHVNTFIDMHDLGDALLRAGFADPVMDVDHIQLTYGTVESLMRDLKSLGAHNVVSQRAKGLTGKGRINKMRQTYEQFRSDGVLPASYEVVFGHAWMPAATQKRQNVSIAVDSLQRHGELA